MTTLDYANIIAKQEYKIGRNDLCPCGSGKKYKKCHLSADESGQPCENSFWEE